MPTAGVLGLAGLVVVGLAELDELEDVEEQGDPVVGRGDELLEEALVGQLQVRPQLLQQLRHRAELAQGHLGEALCRRLPRLLPPGPLPPVTLAPLQIAQGGSTSQHVGSLNPPGGPRRRRLLKSIEALKYSH